MRKGIILIALLFPLSFLGQQQTQYSQYMYSLFSINPAYAGNKDYVQTLMTNRDQWLGVSGAPSSQSLILHAPLKSRTMGLGLNVYNETIGAHGVLGAFGSYSYSMRSANSCLSFGLRAGFYSQRIDPNSVSYRDANDPSSLLYLERKTTPSFDAGAHYFKGNFVAGASVTNLQEGVIYEDTSGNSLSNTMKRHAFVYSGYVFKLNDSWKIRPSVLVKSVGGAPINIDVNLGAIFKDKIHAGLTYRTSSAIVFMMEYYVTKNIRLGYSYDHEMNFFNGNVSTHEMVIGIDFNFRKSSLESPRYL